MSGIGDAFEESLRRIMQLNSAQRTIEQRKAYQRAYQNLRRISQETRQHALNLQKHSYEIVRDSALLTVGRGLFLCNGGCGITNKAILEISHKHRDGYKDEYRPERSSNTFYYAIVRGERPIDDLELLCANCHTLYDKGLPLPRDSL